MTLELSTFGWFHTAISVLALLSGLVVLAGLLIGKARPALSAIYFTAAVVASATGFGFLAGGFGIAHKIGVASLVVLLLAIVARYVFGLRGMWRSVYAVTVVLSVWFFVFFTISESFKRLPALKAMAPTLSEEPFKFAQLGALLLFVGLALVSAFTFRRSDDGGR